MASLLDRHPEILVTLDHNVRQRDSAERAALAELRHGDVHAAVEWYLARGRTSLSSNRTEALAGMVEAWARDVDAGHDTALLAWRRDDVRDLNRLARDLHREQLRDQGIQTGPELTARGGRRYSPGDRLVLLAPNTGERLVTSERLTVTDVDLPGARLRAVTAERRPVVLSGEAIDAEHLDHGYALTVHRAQGATYDRAHVIAAGGGRELAYVALSRARTGTTLHAVADDLDQVRHDLGIDWTNDQHQRWITDAAAPAPQQPEQTPERRRFDAHRSIGALDDDLRDLLAGRGRWEHTPEGANARTRNEIRTRLDDVQRRAAHPNTSRRDRRAARREADALVPVLDAADARWQAVGQPAADELRQRIHVVEADIERDDVAQRRQHLASLLDHRPPNAAIGHDVPGHEGLGL